MRDKILELVFSLGAAEADREVVNVLCTAACRRLDDLLTDGITAEDCAEAYVPAAAWLILDWLQASRGMDGVTALSAGDLTVRRDSRGQEVTLEQRAMELLAPWRKDRSFVFQGVRG